MAPIYKSWFSMKEVLGTQTGLKTLYSALIDIALADAEAEGIPEVATRGFGMVTPVDAWYLVEIFLEEQE